MPIPFFFQALIYVATTAANYYINKGAAKTKSPTPDQFQIPKIEEGRVIPVIFGTSLIDEPQVIWFGNTDLNDDCYYAEVWFALCHGPLGGDAAERLWQVMVEGKKYSWQRNSNDAYVNLEGAKDELVYYGQMTGDYNQGGAIYSGQLDQTIDPPPDYDGSWPSYRGVVMFQGGRGTGEHNGRFWQQYSNILPPMTFLLTRLPHNLTYSGADNQYKVEAVAPGDGHFDSNPAEIIYEILTNAVWGLGFPATFIDTESFRDAGEYLYGEGFGLSLTYNQQESAEDMIMDILGHIEAALYTDPETGKITIKLIRYDYNPILLTELNDDNIIEVQEFSRPSHFDLINEVKVEYSARDKVVINPATGYSRFDFLPKIAQAQEAALYSLQGGFISTKRTYKGITQPELAARIAERDLKELSLPLAKVQLLANREAYDLKPGDCFKLTWSPLGISGLILRVVNVDYGLLEAGQIKLEAIEDMFSLGTAAYSPPPPTEWQWPEVITKGWGYAWGYAWGGVA